MDPSTILALVKMAYACAYRHARKSGYDMPIALTMALVATFVTSWVMTMVFGCLLFVSKAGLLGILAYWILQWWEGRLQNQTLDPLLENIEGRRASLAEWAHGLELAPQAPAFEQQTNAASTTDGEADVATSRLEEEMVKPIQA
ncbi:MAG: hypothetical protein Q9187_001048 [Circinaria calcarea]